MSMTNSKEDIDVNMKIPAACMALCFLLVCGSVLAQRAGQSATIRHGIVDGAQAVDLNDGNALKGVLVGGAVGATLTRSSKSSGRRDRNAAIGAVIGGASQASKTKPGKIYVVSMPDGSSVSVATEQTEINVGDCVTIEQAGNTTNIRRAAQTACAPESASVMQDPDVVEELEDNAAECDEAKQELINASDDADMDRAIRKIEILCY